MIDDVWDWGLDENKPPREFGSFQYAESERPIDLKKLPDVLGPRFHEDRPLPGIGALVQSGGFPQAIYIEDGLQEANDLVDIMTVDRKMPTIGDYTTTGSNPLPGQSFDQKPNFDQIEQKVSKRNHAAPAPSPTARRSPTESDLNHTVGKRLTIKNFSYENLPRPPRSSFVRAAPIPPIGQEFIRYRNMGYNKIPSSHGSTKGLTGAHLPKPPVRLMQDTMYHQSHPCNAGHELYQSLHVGYTAPLGPFLARPPPSGNRYKQRKCSPSIIDSSIHQDAPRKCRSQCRPGRMLRRSSPCLDLASHDGDAARNQLAATQCLHVTTDGATAINAPRRTEVYACSPDPNETVPPRTMFMSASMERKLRIYGHPEPLLGTCSTTPNIVNRR